MIRLPNGKYQPKRGYTWVSKDPHDMRVRRLPVGSPHEVYPNVVYAGNGRIQARFGYQWAGDVYRVELIPAGTPHTYYANVEWDGAGDLRPQKGYTWAANRVGEYRVVGIAIRLPPPLVLTLVKKRERDQRRRWAFDSGMNAFAREDFERAVEALKEAAELSPDNEQYRIFLRKAEVGLRSRERREMAEAYRQRVGTGAPAETYVPTPRIAELYYVRIPPASDEWFRHTDALVDVGNATLRQVQDAARWAKDVAWNQARLRIDNKLKSLPGYDLYRSFQTLKENQELLQEGYGDRVARMAERHLGAVRSAVRSGGRGTDDPLPATDEDRKAFHRLAREVAKPGVEGKWVPSGQPRPPTRKSEHPTTWTEIRHAVGFEVNRWLGR